MIEINDLSLPCMDQSGKECFVSVKDIWSIEQHDNKRESFSLTTKTDVYLCLLRGSMETAGKFFSQLGFEEINAGTILRIDKLVSYDRKNQKVEFPNGKSIQVSRRNISKVKHLPKPP